MSNSMVTAARVATAALVIASASVACGGSAGEGGGAATAGSSTAKHELLNNPAPDFAADSVNGKGKIALSQWSGKVVLVDFWATWCEPCKKSFPKLEELRVKYAASGFELVAISEDDEQNGVKGFGTTYGAKFPLVWDKDKSVANKWHPPAMPSSFILDKKGVVRFVHLGYHDGEEKVIETELKSLL
ncbi:MAG: thioredoxin family protein [Myxococcaceae bacterium]|nr:thioredoxin family protein [Myxococcaceae bacterium]